jgi:hypothetical protein
MNNFQLACAVALLAGCANTLTAPNYQQRFGDAVRQGRMAQTLNPNPAPIDIQGLDGRAAAEAMGRYQDAFKAPPPTVNVINIGGAIGGGGGGNK